jgi:c(7)-type cytochrome triheme protein
VRWAMRKRISGRSVALMLAGLACIAALAATQSRWTPLAKDGIHDPKNPGLAQLQEPALALASLPPDTAGNMVRWVQALEQGAINPRTNILPETIVRVRDDDIIIAKNGSMPAVKFPHRAHTLWLDCSNCHEALFESKAGANRFSMQAILDGEQCGLCHGAVSFPLTECNRCHSVTNAALRAMQAPAAKATP